MFGCWSKGGIWGLRIGEKEKGSPEKNIFFQDRLRLSVVVADLTKETSA